MEKRNYDNYLKIIKNEKKKINPNWVLIRHKFVLFMKKDNVEKGPNVVMLMDKMRLDSQEILLRNKKKRRSL